MPETKQRIRTRENDYSISLCMIVKDEEKLLPQCLASVRDQVDEIIVVDTGSTDKTVTIAEDFGAKIYHHPWENDFSKHRNQSISYATGDWIFILDADEVFQYAGGRTLKDDVVRASEASCDSMVMRVMNSASDSRETICSDSIRLFQNNGKIHYVGIVHNNLVGYGHVGLSANQIVHFGYDLGEGVAGKKFERTTTLLKKQIAENNSDAGAHMYLGSSYASLDLLDDSLNEAMIAVGLIESQGIKNPLYVRAYYGAVRALILQDRFDEASDICMKAMNRFGNQVDILAALVMIFVRKKEWDKVLEYGNRYLKKLADYKGLKGECVMVNVATYGDSWKIYGWLGTARLHLGDIEQADELYQKAVQLSTDKEAVNREIGLELVSSGHIDQSIPFLDEACRLEGEEKKSKIVEALFKIGVLKNDQPLKQRTLNDIANFDNPEPEWLLEMSEFARRYNDILSAAALFFEVLKQDEDHVMARLRIASIFLEAGHIEGIVEHCDHLLKALRLPGNIVLSSIKDLAGLFADIGRSLSEPGNQEASILAQEISHKLLASRTAVK
jgi:glycosyltransferase involved in cell wall biosynthesis